MDDNSGNQGKPPWKGAQVFETERIATEADTVKMPALKPVKRPPQCPFLMSRDLPNTVCRRGGCAWWFAPGKTCAVMQLVASMEIR